MIFSVKQYITETVAKKAKIKYDQSVKQWVGVLDHVSGFICVQKKTKGAVIKKLAGVLEGFIILDLGRKNEIKAPKIPRAYKSA